MNQEEKTQPGIFHIHIDANRIDKSLYDYAVEKLNFYDSDFNGHPEGFLHFEPEKHLTLKLKTKEEFEEKWKLLEDVTSEHELTGYLEGEYVPVDDFIPFKEYRDIPIPFKIKRRKLDGSLGEEFRQTEIHLTMEKEKSHPELIQKLLRSGLYGAYIPKHHGTFLVLTILGYIKDIVPLITVVKDYITKSGGAYLCTIKEERAIKYKLYNISTLELPEIADSITYLD